MNYHIELQLKELRSEDLIRKAEKYDIPIPVYFDMSYWQEESGYRFLSDNARYDLRKKIQHEFRDKFEISFKVIAALTGIVGALIGLFSILKK